MCENGGLEGIVGVLKKLDEAGNIEEYEVATKIMKIIEHLLELWDETS